MSILQDLLHIIPCFRERDRFYPVDWIDAICSRVPVTSHPFERPARAGVVGDQRKYIRTPEFLDQIPEMSCAELGIVFWIGKELGIVFDLVLPADELGGARHQLHQASRARMAARL